MLYGLADRLLVEKDDLLQERAADLAELLDAVVRAYRLEAAVRAVLLLREADVLRRDLRAEATGRRLEALRRDFV